MPEVIGTYAVRPENPTLAVVCLVGPAPRVGTRPHRLPPDIVSIAATFPVEMNPLAFVRRIEQGLEQRHTARYDAQVDLHRRPYP